MPIYSVTAPTGKKYSVQAPEGATQEQIIQYAQQQVAGASRTPARPDRGVFDAFTSSVGRGIDRAAITLGDELPALVGSALGQDDYARAQLEEAEIAKANLQALNPTQIASYKDISGIGDALIYATESIGENIPNILGLATGTGAATLAARKLAGSEIKKKIKNQAIGSAQDRLKKQLAVAQAQASDQAIVPAAFLGSYALNAPEVFSNIYDATGELAPGAALLTGSMSAALDSILPTAVVKRLRKQPALKAKVVSELAKKSGVKPSVLSAIGLGAGKGFALEGVTESAQEALSLVAERIVGENFEALTSPEFERLVESGLRGGLAGSAFGAAGGAQDGIRIRNAVKRQEQAERDAEGDKEQDDAEQKLLEQQKQLEDKGKKGREQKAAQEKADAEAINEAIVNPESATMPNQVSEYVDQFGLPVAAEAALEKVDPIIAKKIEQDEARKQLDEYVKEQQDDALYDFEQSTDIPNEARDLVDQFGVPIRQEPTEVAPEVETEVAPEVEKEVAPEVEKEVTPEVEKEVTPEVEKEVTPEVEKEATPKVETEVAPKVGTEVTPKIEAEVKATGEADPLLQKDFNQIDRIYVPQQLRNETKFNELQEKVKPLVENILKTFKREDIARLNAFISEDLSKLKKNKANSKDVPLINELIKVKKLQKQIKNIEDSFSNKSQKASLLQLYKLITGTLGGSNAYAEFKENLKNSKSGYKAIEETLSINAALEYLAGDMYSAFLPGKSGGKAYVPVVGKTSAGQTKEEQFADYKKNILTDKVWNKATQTPQAYEEGKARTPERSFVNTYIKTGGEIGVKYYNSLTEEQQNLVRQKVLRLVRQEVFGGVQEVDTSQKSADLTVYTDASAARIAVFERLIREATTEKDKKAIQEKLDKYIKDLTEKDVQIKKLQKENKDAVNAQNALRNRQFIFELEGKKLSAKDKKALDNATAAALETEKKLQVLLVEANKGPVNPTGKASKKYKEKTYEGLDQGALNEAQQEVASENQQFKDLEEFVANASNEFGDPNNPENISANDAASLLFSVADGTINTPTTVEQTVNRLAEIGIDATNSDRVSVTATVAEAGLTNLPGINESTQGVVIGDKAYLFTDNIQVGNEVGIFLHEVGTHIGLVNLVGRANYNFLVNRVKEFAKLNDGSRESGLAKAALERIKNAEETTGIKLDQETKNDEMLAYFVEAAVQNGTNPSKAARQQSKLSVFFKRLLAGIKSYFRKVGWMDAKDLDAQGIVDLAYGGALLATRAPQAKMDRLSSRLLFSQASNANELFNMQTKLFNIADEATYNPKAAIVMDSLSSTSATGANIFYGALSFDQMVDKANTFNPTLAANIKKLGEFVALKRFKNDEYNRDISEALVEVNRLRDEAIEGLSEEQTKKVVNEFNRVTNESSIEEVDLRLSRAEILEADLKYETATAKQGKTKSAVSIGKLPADRVAKINELSRRFDKMPKQLQEAYKIIINTNQKYGDMLLDFLTAKLVGLEGKQKAAVLSATQKLRLQLESNRIVPYVALVRNGNYWVDVTLKENGARYTEAFDTASAAKRALNEFKNDKNIVVDSEKGVYERITNDILRDNSGESKAFQSILKLLSEVEKPNPTGDKDVDARNLENHQKTFDSVIEMYYNAFPSNALKQHFKNRKGLAGYNQDVIQNFAQISIKMADEVASLETTAEMNNLIDAIVTENAGKAPVGAEANLRKEIIKRSAFLRNPNPPVLARQLSALGYNMYLAGNISSALVNLTQLPLVTFPKLVAEFGFTRALEVTLSMMGRYIRNLTNPSVGRDDNTTLTVPGVGASLADVTLFTKDVRKNNGLDKLYTTALQRNAIRRTTSQELQEARQTEFFGSKIGSTLDRVMLSANWAFQNSERANREIGILAAYELAIEKFNKLKAEGKLNKTTEQIQELAIERALKITEEASGTALQELGPRWFQSGFGKVIGTFKRFVFSQLYLENKLALNSLNYYLPKNHKSDSSMPIDPDTGAPINARKFALRQLAFIAMSSAVFAGARGMPMLWVGEMMYDLANDEDDPDYLNFDHWMKSHLGDVAHRGPFAHLTGIDVSNRIGFNGLLYRKDDRKMEDMGFVYGAFAAVGGPVLSYADQVRVGVERLSDDSRLHPVLDGVQMVMPAAIRNGMKSVRLITEGAVDKAGRPVVENVNLYNAIMQGVGFSPTRVAKAYEVSNILYTQERKAEDMKRSLLNKRFYAIQARDRVGLREIDEKIRRFNNKKSVRAYGLQITGDTKLRSLKMKRVEAAKSYRDVVVPRDVAIRAARAYNGLDIDE